MKTKTDDQIGDISPENKQIANRPTTRRSHLPLQMCVCAVCFYVLSFLAPVHTDILTFSRGHARWVHARFFFPYMQVPGDGNCLFHAISACLDHACNGTHPSLDLNELMPKSAALRKV